MHDQGRLSFVLGGARSGKSAYAERLVTALPPPWIYLATARALDDEMTARIAAHRASRSAGWQTLEEPKSLTETLASLPAGRPVLVDCLTLWLSNRLLARADLSRDAEALGAVLAAPRGPWVVVTTRSGCRSCPTIRSAANSATRPEGSTSGWRPAPTRSNSWSRDCLSG